MNVNVNNPPVDQRGTCSHCLQERLWVGPNKAFNALCRRDNETYICSPCGVSQAMSDITARLERERMEALSKSVMGKWQGGGFWGDE